MAGRAIALKECLSILSHRKISGKKERYSEKKNEGYPEST
jgi:hypothetical protein